MPTIKKAHIPMIKTMDYNSNTVEPLQKWLIDVIDLFGA